MERFRQVSISFSLYFHPLVIFFGTGRGPCCFWKPMGLEDSEKRPGGGGHCHEEVLLAGSPSLQLFPLKLTHRAGFVCGSFWKEARARAKHGGLSSPGKAFPQPWELRGKWLFSLHGGQREPASWGAFWLWRVSMVLSSLEGCRGETNRGEQSLLHLASASSGPIISPGLLLAQNKVSIYLLLTGSYSSSRPQLMPPSQRDLPCPHSLLRCPSQKDSCLTAPPPPPRQP